MPSGQGSSAIQADLLKYPSNSWRWEIIADTGGKKAYELWRTELSQLERKYIRQFDSVRNGYNIVDGSLVYYKPTLDEVRLSWNGRSFHRSQMQRVIYSAIDDYQCLQLHGKTPAQYQKQQEIISRYGSIEEYDRQMERERREQDARETKERREPETPEGSERREDGCTWIIIIIVGVLFIILASQC